MAQRPVQESLPTIDVQELLWKLRQHKSLLALPIVVALCGAITYIKVTPPLYESYVTVEVTGRTRVSAALEPLVRGEQDRESPRETIALLDGRIHSRPFLGKVVGKLGLTQSDQLLRAAREQAKQFPGITPEDYIARVASVRLGKKIAVRPVGARYVRITATDRDPRAAVRLAEAITDILLEESKRGTLNRAQARGTFSADQAAVYQERLRDAEKALRAYQESAISVRLTDNVLNDNNLDGARGLVRDADVEIAEVRGRMQEERVGVRPDFNASTEAVSLTSAAASGLESRLVSLESRYAVAILQGDRGAAMVPSLRGEISDVRQALYEEYRTLARLLPGDVSDAERGAAAGIAIDRAILRSLRAKRDRVASMITDYVRQVQSTPRRQIELDRLQQEVQTNRDLLATLQREATSSRLSEALEMSQLAYELDVVEQAQIPFVPTWPSPLKILGSAMVFGPILSVGLVFGVERLGAVLRTVEQAEQEIGAPVIGTIPRVEGWAKPGSFLQNHWAAVSILAVLLLTGIFYLVHSVVHSGQGRVPTSLGAPR